MLASLARALAVSAVLLSPFMPAKMQALREQLGAEGDPPTLDDLPRLSAAGWKVSKGEVLFPRPELAG